MNTRTRLWIFLFLTAADLSPAQTPFSLGFEGPDVISGSPGSVQTATYLCILNGAGAEAWRVWFALDSGIFRGLTIAGTTADRERNNPLLNAGFFGSEAHCLMILGFPPGFLTLSSGGSIVALTVEVTIPSSPGTLNLSIDEEDSDISTGGHFVKPQFLHKQIALNPCSSLMRLKFSGNSSVTACPGLPIVETVDCLMAPSFGSCPFSGIRGWDVIVFCNGGEITGVDLGPGAGPFLGSGSQQLDLLAGAARSRVALESPWSGTGSFLRVSIKGSPVPGGDSSCTLSYSGGSTVEVLNGQQGSSSVTGAGGDPHVIVLSPTVPNRQPFLRGDVNGDGMVNISDSNDLLSFLYHTCIGFQCDEVTIECPDAVDLNDDGMLDELDLPVLLTAVYQRRPIPQPFPVCGNDPTSDSMGCCRTKVCPTKGRWWGLR